MPVVRIMPKTFCTELVTCTISALYNDDEIKPFVYRVKITKKSGGATYYSSGKNQDEVFSHISNILSEEQIYQEQQKLHGTPSKKLELTDLYNKQMSQTNPFIISTINEST